MSITTIADDCTAAAIKARNVAEIHEFADRLLAEQAAKPQPVAKVDGYQHEVDTIDEGQAFLRAGVDSGQCAYMEIVRVTATDSGAETLWVVDTTGGRRLCSYCKVIGSTWKTVATRGIVRLVPEAAA